MSRNRIIALAAAVVFLAAAAATIFMKRGSEYGAGGPGGTAGQAPMTRENFPKSALIAVPDANAQNVPENTAVPETVAPAGGSQRGDAQYRSFKVRIENNQFKPAEIYVNIGDTVRITVTAADKKYDYTQPDYGWSIFLSKGESKSVQFDATADGRFKIFCKSCGGPANGPAGYLNVVPKQ